MARQTHEQISAAAEVVNESTSEFMRNAALDRADKIWRCPVERLCLRDQFDSDDQGTDVPDHAPNLRSSLHSQGCFLVNDLGHGGWPITTSSTRSTAASSP